MAAASSSPREGDHAVGSILSLLGSVVRTYVVVTGIVAAVLTALHVWRMFEEPHLIRQPSFIAITLASAAISLWAWRVARR